MKEKLLNVKFLQKAENYIKANGSTISMFGAMVTLGLAIYSAFKASSKIAEIQEEYESDAMDIFSRYDGIEGDYVEAEMKEAYKNAKSMRNIKYVLAYKFVILFGCSSLGLMFLSKYIDGITIAGLTTLAATNQDKLEKLAKNAKEMIGEEKFEEIENKTLEDLIMDNFTDGPVAMQPKHRSGQMFVDTDTGVIFQMDKKDLQAAMEWAEDYCKRNHGLYMDKWYSQRGLEPPTNAKVKCWGPKNPFKAHFGTRTCFGMTLESIEYENASQPPKYAGIPGA